LRCCTLLFVALLLLLKLQLKLTPLLSHLLTLEPHLLFMATLRSPFAASAATATTAAHGYSSLICSE
jgi:hypothetical protein